MEGIHDIYLRDKVVGEAQVRREGLYYRIRCRCKLVEESLCRIKVDSVSLGVLIPDGDFFCLDTKLPVKRFENQNANFLIQPNRPVLAGKFIPIKPEEPFSYIERLKNAYLARQDGQLGIVIKEEAGT